MVRRFAEKGEVTLPLQRCREGIFDCSENVFSGTGVSPVQAQAEACGYSFDAAEGGGATFSCFGVYPRHMNDWFPSSAWERVTKASDPETSPNTFANL